MSAIYYVSPRYTAGSPAEVSREVAEAVVQQELEGYERACEGRYGELALTKAMILGLGGIVERREERAGGWDIHDLLICRNFHRRTLPVSKVRSRDIVLAYGGDDARPSRAPFCVEDVIKVGKDICLVFHKPDGGRDFVVLPRTAEVKIEREDS